jgi:hypothetical protein
MKNKELHALRQNLMSCADIKSTNLQIKIARNLKKIAQEMEAVADTDFAKEYEKLRKAAIEKHAKKDKDGNAVMINNGTAYSIANMEAFQQEIVEAAKTTGYSEWEEKDCDLKFWQLLRSDFPDDADGRIIGLIELIPEEPEDG